VLAEKALMPAAFATIGLAIEDTIDTLIPETSLAGPAARATLRRAAKTDILSELSRE